MEGKVVISDISGNGDVSCNIYFQGLSFLMKSFNKLN